MVCGKEFVEKAKELASARPVWFIDTDTDERVYCSECGEEALRYDDTMNPIMIDGEIHRNIFVMLSNYCPNCGAKMNKFLVLGEYELKTKIKCGTPKITDLTGCLESI